MKEEKKFKPKSYISLIIVLIVIAFMIPLMINKFKTNQEGYICYESVCSKTTLDQFNSCKDVGQESTGFLSYEHYYICDGNKIVKRCLEYKEVKTNQTFIQVGMKCIKEEKKQ